MELWTVIIGGVFTLAATLATVVPTIIATRKKTEEAVKSAATEAVKAATSETTKQINTLQTTLNEHIAEGEAEKAKAQRIRILRFYDEICANKHHNASYWEDIMDDCDQYIEFAEAHKSTFKNHRGVAAIKHIQETYDTLKESGKFEIKD